MSLIYLILINFQRKSRLTWYRNLSPHVEDRSRSLTRAGTSASWNTHSLTPVTKLKNFTNKLFKGEKIFRKRGNGTPTGKTGETREIRAFLLVGHEVVRKFFARARSLSH